MINPSILGQNEQGLNVGAQKGSNRLADETSPYLLQHANNPVDWYPWGKQALNRATRENKPIFLSIGYSACHWCHVMERESFEDPDTADILNRHFVSIKVDREERPDLDEIYMAALHLMTGRGGWPLNVFLTPNLKPLYGGTYFPPKECFGMPAFKRVLNSIAKLWFQQPKDMIESSEKITQAIKVHTSYEPSLASMPDSSFLANAVTELLKQFDDEWGGFSIAPKFPQSTAISLLLRQYSHTRENSLMRAATVTLDRMAQGGIFDQLGGGFHRYSVDDYWLVPHFEKMLYDNAMLSKVYLEAWQATGKDLYRRVTLSILDYVLRDMTDVAGGFHSAEDADSEGVEGKFYVWSKDEVGAVLGEEDADLFFQCYGLTDEGNFEGKNILHIPRNESKFDNKNDSRKQVAHHVDQLQQRLLAEREKRVRPAKDDKVIAAWNGMMISSLARGYQATGDVRYLNAAKRAANFLLKKMVLDGVLMRTYRGTDRPEGTGISKIPGYLDDHAEIASSLIDLYEASFDQRWLREANTMARRMVGNFWDRKDGGFFYTSAAHDDLLVRTKSFHDNAVPSSNATAAIVLMRLSKLLGNHDYWDKAEQIFKSTSGSIANQPMAHFGLLCALDFFLGPVTEIAIVGNDNNTTKMLEIVHNRFLPNKILALARPTKVDSCSRLIPLLEDKATTPEKATVYVCENFTCKQSVDTPADLHRTLTSLK